MTKLLRLLNRLKAEVRLDILADTQKHALDEIVRLWKFPGHVNLYGEPGSGKTAVGWAASRTLDTRFLSSLGSFRESTIYPLHKAIIDNSKSDSRTIRATLAEAQLRGSRRTLLITTDPNRLGLPTIQLKPPERRDVDIIYHNLSLLEYYPIEPTYSQNLWDIIYSVL